MSIRGMCVCILESVCVCVCVCVSNHTSKYILAYLDVISYKKQKEPLMSVPIYLNVSNHNRRF